MGKYEKQSVIERIEEIRTERKISQMLLCNMTGISRSNFYYIISGKVSPTLETLDRIADAMGVSLSELFKPSRRYAAAQKIAAKRAEEYFSKNFSHWNDKDYLKTDFVAEKGEEYK